ncbi:MAG: hypothetical protein J7L91_02730 [Candidatus Korarchaeota archaeon]|nr:hypothetical protein [Candidatus Korarchaeota archaeon]
MSIKIGLSKGEGLLLRCPASLKVISGEVEAWGGPIEEVEVPLEGVDLLLTARRDSTVEVEGQYIKLENPIPEWWEQLPEVLAGKKVLFLGRIDSGKSSSILYLTNKLTSMDHPLTIIDSDVGQSDLGPPGVISSKRLEEPVIHMKLLEPDFMYFIGDKTPSGHFLPMVRGVFEALKNSDTDTILVNTTGFVDGGAARALKRFKMEFVDPDIIIAIEKEKDDLEHLMRIVPRGVEVKRFPSPVGSTGKDRSYRMAARRALVRRYLEGGQVRRVNLLDIELRNTFLLTGKKKIWYVPFLEGVLGTKIHWLEESPDMLIALTEGGVDRRKAEKLSDLLNKEVRIAPLDLYRGLYVGLLAKNRCAGVGIVQSLNIREGVIDVLTKYDENIEGLAFGYIRFNAEGEELGARGMGSP